MDQTSITTANIKQTLTRLHAQFAADHFQLVGLRLRDLVLPVREIGTRVDHLRSKKERIEFVGKSVVELDEVLVVGCLAPASSDFRSRTPATLPAIASLPRLIESIRTSEATSKPLMPLAGNEPTVFSLSLSATG